MRLDLSLNQRLEQRQILSPQIIQSIEILQLPTLELTGLIQQEIQENPMIELEPGEGPEISTEDVEKMAVDSESLSNEFDRIEAGWGEDGAIRSHRGGSSLKDRKFEAMQNTAAKSMSLQEHLLEQFRFLETSKRIRKIGEFIILNIDDRGYLSYANEEILDSLDADGEEFYTMEEVELALGLVRSLDPPGVGGRNLKEVLLLQIPDPEDYKLERIIIERHLDDLEKNKLPKIARDTGESIERVKEAIEFISHLSPRPGLVYSSEAPHYIVPDVVVSKVDEKYEVRVESEYIPQVRLSGHYREMLEKHRDNPKVIEFIKKKVESAKWLMKSIEQRQSTLQRIATEMVDFQEDFLEKGVSALRPLKMQTIADRVGVHVSTVGRAISGKYIQTPRGIYPLKFFFTGGTITDEGTKESTVSIKSRIKDILENEDKKDPLSDEAIVGILKDEGLNIARRTITKYRKALGYPSSRQRKEY